MGDDANEKHFLERFIHPRTQIWFEYLRYSHPLVVFLRILLSFKVKRECFFATAVQVHLLIYHRQP